jgi:hypothetical protein
MNLYRQKRYRYLNLVNFRPCKILYNPKNCFYALGRKYDPGCSSRIRIFIFPGSLIHGSKRHRIRIRNTDLYWCHVGQVCEREREKLAGRNGEELAAAAAVSPPTQMKPPTPVTILSMALLPQSSRNNYRKRDIQGRLPFPLPPHPPPSHTNR